MNYDTLRREGIKHIECLGSKFWTDYNSHDPGITILEQLCYALTDLLYRINYDIPDLLAEGDANPFASLLLPSQILPSNPVTLQDMRKVAVDVPGVRNAWTERIESAEPCLYFHKEEKIVSLSQEDQTEPIALQGIYQVWIEEEDNPQGASREGAVAERLHQCRSLAEDFKITALQNQDVAIDASIEIDKLEDAEKLQQAVYEEIAKYFSPPVKFYSLQERLDAGFSLGEIFEGPLLQQGFIDDQELRDANKRTELRTSDLIRVFMDIPGVRAVRHLSFSTGAANTTTRWLLKLDNSKVPRLDKSKSNLTFIKGEVEIHLSPPSGGMANTLPRLPKFCDVPQPTSRNRRIGKEYYSIQHQFPDAYGINSVGLPASASPSRKGIAKQLKAYLLLFDQLLANQFSQLANINCLFSFAEKDAAALSYFFQQIDDAELGLDEDMQNYLGIWTAPDKETRRCNLEKIISRFDNKQERRNRFLNHLLARFAEQFELVVAADASKEPGKQKTRLLMNKQSYLKQYEQVGCCRNTAANCLADVEQRTALERRIRLKLDIDDAADFYIVEHILLRPVSWDRNQHTGILSDTQCRDPYSLRISVILSEDFLPYDVSADLSDARKAKLQRQIQQQILEELPAHLAASFFLLKQEKLTDFKIIHQRWRNAAKNDGSVNRQQLRSARDQLIDFLGFGKTHPLADIAVAGDLVAYGEKAAVRIPFSQSGVIYQLYDENAEPIRDDTGEIVSAEGNEGEIWLTPIVKEQVTYKILACKKAWPDSYKVFLQKKAIVKVGLNTSLAAEISEEIDADGNPVSDTNDPSSAAPRRIRITSKVKVKITDAQEGVAYRLYSRDGEQETLLSQGDGVPGKGKGEFIEIISHKIEEDVVLFIKAEKIKESDGKSRWLAKTLPLLVQANPDTFLSAIPSPPIVDWNQEGIIQINSPQNNVFYQAFLHELNADDFYFLENSEKILIKIAVPGFADVQFVSPQWKNIWDNLPENYTEAGYAKADNGKVELHLPSLTADSLIIVKAEKTHAGGEKTSSIQLKQSAVFLVRPSVQRPLLHLLIKDSKPYAIKVSNGQTGIFYHFSLQSDNKKEICLPAYFHDKKEGLGKLRIGGDFVTAASENYTDVAVEFYEDVTFSNDSELHIRARKARTNIWVDLYSIKFSDIPIEDE